MEQTGSQLKVDVSPSVLVWARESISLPIDVSAKRLGIKPDTLVRIEDGKIPVTISKLRQMAKVYDRPLIAFFLPEPPAEAATIPDFRVIHEHESRTWSPQLHKAYRRVVSQREVVLELASGEEDAIPEIDLILDVSADMELAGGRVREWLNPAESRTSDQYVILNTWINMIEDKGILVTQVSDVSIEEMRGFSIGEHPLPVIAINGSDFPRGKLFTLMHELVHVLLHRGGLCDLEDDAVNEHSEGQRLEWFCNEVAAVTLMPRDAVVRALASTNVNRPNRWSDEDLAGLASQFGVSTEALLVRLVTLRLASRESYRERRPAFQEQYRVRRMNSKGFLTYYREQIRNLGRRYITTVWRAYERGDVSDPDLSTYLNTRLQNIPRLVQEAGIDS